MATIDYTFQYFNRYAYVQVAVYGKTFCQSAKATWNMFLLHGIDAIVNDDFTGSVLFLGTLLSGVVTALVTGSACSLVGIGDENPENYTVWVVILLAFVIGLVVGSATMEVLDSGVATVFVCFVEQPERLRLVDPEFHDKLRETYPILQTSFLPSQV
jgi:hypothetical protein